MTTPRFAEIPPQPQPQFSSPRMAPQPSRQGGQVFMRANVVHTGPWSPSAVQNFNVTGSFVLIIWSMDSFNTVGGFVNTGQLIIDGAVLDTSPMAINPANVHTTHPTKTSMFAQGPNAPPGPAIITLTPGSHSLQFGLAGTNASSDGNDKANAIILEFFI